MPFGWRVAGNGSVPIVAMGNLKMRGNLNKPEPIRLDRWLWASRFFKTRSQATTAVLGGKVSVNGDHVKPARRVALGDQIAITKGSSRFTVRVTGFASRRGPAKLAATLYEETQESREARERLARSRRLGQQAAPRGRPDRRERRRLIALSRKR